MCTFTYFPQIDGGFIIATNRDESTKRQVALEPNKFELNGFKCYFPKDPVGNGTWIATSKDWSVCLLNGGKEKHIKKANYQKSRGLVLLDILSLLNQKLIDPKEKIDLNNIEPFTLFIINHHNPAFYQWIYSEDESLQVNILDEKQPFIHSSTTLYNAKITSIRKDWFQDFLGKCIYKSVEEIVHFHSYTNKDNKEFGLQIDRNGITKTLSLTMVEYGKKHQMHYFDFVSNLEKHLICK